MTTKEFASKLVKCYQRNNALCFPNQTVIMKDYEQLNPETQRYWDSLANQLRPLFEDR